MKLNQIIELIENVAPTSSQEVWDNSGLQIGSLETQVTNAVICLDVSLEVVEFAKNNNCNLIITHHPLFFEGVKNITDKDSKGKIIINAIANNIAIYSSHTPFDIAEGGINDFLSKKLNLNNVQFLTESGIGRVGEISQSVRLSDFITFLKKELNLNTVRVNNNKDQIIKKVALCGGSGGSLIEDAIEKKADIYISGDFKYNHFIDNASQIILVDIGHYESEIQFVEIISALIQKKIPTFATHIYKSNPTEMV